MSRILVFFLLCAVLVSAQGPPQKAFPWEYDMHDFPNGLRLVTVPADFPNVVALYIVVSTGSRNEIEPGKSGFAHLFEHMMFRGTKRFPPAKYDQVIKEMGAARNAYTTDDRTVYHTTFSKEDLEKIMDVEADRFQNLEYPETVFRTESLAVLGEYNKNSQSPTRQLFEVLRDTAFDKHTYKHTTMGFLRDIMDMPNQYQYSLEFFDRWYRPEYTTIIVAGDVTVDGVRAIVDKYWSGWERGSYKVEVPAEPPQTGPRTGHIDWPSPTLPWIAIGFKGAAYSDTEKDQVTLDILSFLGFDASSDLYKKLVLEEQKVDIFGPSNPDRVDPQLFTILARVKNEADVPYVRDQVLAKLEEFKETPVDAQRLAGVKRHLRYSFALNLDNSEAIADILAPYMSLRRTPETINKVYALYDEVTAEDIQRVARKYFQEDSRTIVTLAGGSSQ